MWRAIALLWLLGRAAPQMHAVQRYFIARNTRAHAAPVRTGYVYRQMNNGPPTIETFHSQHSGIKEQADGVRNGTSSEANELQETTESTKEIKSTKMPSEELPTTSENSILFSEKNLWPGGDAFGKLKLAASSMVKSYDSVFSADDEDVRTDFKNSYDIWPFLYQNIYKYEPTKDVDVENAKGKRYAIPTNEKVIPVQEKVEEAADDENAQNKPNSLQDHKHDTAATTDNPIFGNQPFFSYVLNDYFDKTDEDDPTTFKGLSWGNEFDQEMGLQDIGDYAKRMRRLEDNTPIINREKNEKKSNTFMEHDATHDSLKSKGRDVHRESESREKGEDSKHRYDGRHQYDGENYRGFKDFVDSFAHRFGSEDHDRASNYAKKNNANKGEKKKGFRTIHHKDEYQEHHDFFDNNDNSENVEEKGASNVRVGGSEAFLRSSAGAATGSDRNKLSKAENTERNQFERNHEDKQRYNGIERELDQYRDVAKRTARNNDADYFDRYMI